MKFYMLTEGSGRKIIVNLDQVVSIEPYANGSKVTLTTGRELYVLNKFNAHCGTLDVSFA